MARGAKTLLDTCVAVKPGETVLIVTDMVEFAIARVIAAAAVERGAETVVTVMQPRARAGQEPPRADRTGDPRGGPRRVHHAH
jgi:leucyl aminopeptidase (aminopeptidase T)